ncbi:unnamed protein product, partial [Rotaria sp. Silwood1]
MCNFTGLNLTDNGFDFTGETRHQAFYLVAIGFATIILTYLQVILWSVSAERQTRTIRRILLRSIISKDVSYFDTHETGTASTCLIDVVDKIHDGIGDKLGSATQFSASFITGFVLGNLGQASPHFQMLNQAKAAAYIVWQMIDTLSHMTRDPESGLKKNHLIGDIRFSNIHFSYPSRPDVQVLDGLSFNVMHGQTVALVGPSGSGKSTCVQLLQRFYDPNSGSVLIDDNQVEEYNLKWLRQQIGVINQEPVLFQATIRENILLGCESATDEEVQKAAKIANAHNFIMSFPEKYETLLGQHGASLSGGQKQRIAIARALIRDPKILILDEATSALDNESERLVQEALYRVAESRTMLVIAHRLSTIRNADKIVVIKNGKIIEEGNHEALMLMQGAYYDLVEAQKLNMNEEDNEQLESQEVTTIIHPNQTDNGHLNERKISNSAI